MVDFESRRNLDMVAAATSTSPPRSYELVRPLTPQKGLPYDEAAVPGPHKATTGMRPRLETPRLVSPALCARMTLHRAKLVARATVCCIILIPAAPDAKVAELVRSPLAPSPNVVHAWWDRVSSTLFDAPPLSGAAPLARRVRSPAPVPAQGCREWPTWKCGVSTFPWVYSRAETTLFLEGACASLRSPPRPAPRVPPHSLPFLAFPAAPAAAHARPPPAPPLEGFAIVTPEEGRPVEIRAGDIGAVPHHTARCLRPRCPPDAARLLARAAMFPAGMTCLWDIRAPVRRQYSID